MLVWACGGSLACAPTQRSEPTTHPTASADIEAAQAFQAEYERELRADEHSFLTVVDAHYLSPGSAHELPIADAVARLEASAEALVVTHAEQTQRVEDRSVIAIDPSGRFSLTVSRQESDWRVLVHDRDAPMRDSFPGIEWFPIDAGRIVDASFEARTTREPQVVQTSRGVTKTLYVAGEVRFELDGGPLELLVFAYSPEPAPDEPLLIPFRDETTGHESYAAGRYLEPTLPAGGSLRLDFNRATNPLCAYSEHYNCPVPPRYNTLPVAIRAGAKAPTPH